VHSIHDRVFCSVLPGGGMQKKAFWLWLVLVMGTSNALGHDQDGKIYLDGAWIEAAQEPTFSLRSIFDDLFFPGRVDPQSLAISYLERNLSAFTNDRNAAWVPLMTAQAGPELVTQRLSRLWNGLPVVNGDAVVQLIDGRVSFASADSTDFTRLPQRPSISADEARAVAFSSYRGRALSATEPELKVLVLGAGGSRIPNLVYEITVHDRDEFASDIHFIDAVTAQELLVTTNVHTLANRKVMAGRGDESDFGLDEGLWELVFADKGCDLSSESAAAAPPSPCISVDARVYSSALSAWNNSGLVHEYFLTTHNRNSIDGNGMALKSVVNFGGRGFPNAAWYNDKAIMLFGVGDESKFNDFALPLDVAAHEITHGITSRSSNLEYASEPGALNESYSDVFGKLVAFRFGKASDWKLGQDLFKEDSDFVRDLEHPEVAHMRDFRFKGQLCSRLNDFCGVHSNSGIPNRAAVLLAKKIGLERLGRIYYLTLTQLLRTNSDFREARAQTEAACALLYGRGNPDCRAVSEAFAAVGI
jgi:Zn-dependent metalloprotease